MRQVINELKQSLLQKKIRYAKQLKRHETLQGTIRNTEKDIEQLEYTLQRIEAVERGLRKQRTIPHNQINEFFIRISRIFDRLQHRLHHSFNYRIACMLIYSYYQIRSRTRLPGKEFLRFEIVLTYFKRERAII